VKHPAHSLIQLIMMTEYMIVGRVMKPFGVRGDVKVLPITDRPERYNDLSFVFIQKGDGFEKLEIERVRLHGGHVCFKPLAFSSREEAAVLTGELLYIDREHAAAIEEGSYYVYDLVGCTVKTSDGKVLGVLREIQNAGSCDVYVVIAADDGAHGELLIPAISDVVKKIDVRAKEIVIEPLEGLL
jgi:16S rRNA processing protein RimM